MNAGEYIACIVCVKLASEKHKTITISERDEEAQSEREKDVVAEIKIRYIHTIAQRAYAQVHAMDGQ